VFTGKVYLDHGGTTVYARSLIDSFSEKMISNLYGNPHSASEPARLSGEAVDTIREKALRFFQADPEHFDLIFTANATAAIKLVAESFRDLALTSSVTETFWYGYHKDAHTSLVGIREYTSGNHHCFGSDREVDEWLGGYTTRINSSNDNALPGLFAYPGQSNMTGRRLPLSWTADLRNSSKIHHQNTYSLLDVAALATTAQLDLSNPDTAPDFTALSFYKIFGFPDLGALIVRKKSGHILAWRKYFGGGTVNALTVFHEASHMRKDGTLHDGLEDGTLPFHSIVALGCALETHKRLYGSMNAISRHTTFLGYRLYTRLSNLFHANGRPAVVIYNDTANSHPYSDPTTQGATIAFNLVRADGSPIRYSLVEQQANNRDIYLRSGGLCNAGGIASHLEIEPWQFKRAWSAGHHCGDAGDTEIINGKPTGVVRASLGAMSTVGDVDVFITFLSDTFVEHSREELPAFRRVDIQTRLPSRNGGLRDDSRSAGFVSRAEGLIMSHPPPVPSLPIPLWPSGSTIGSGSYSVHRAPSFDFNAEGRIASRPPQTQRLKANESVSTPKAPPIALRSKRSFFKRESHETSRVPESERTTGVSEFSGSTLTAEDSELAELVKRNMMLVEDKSVGNKTKGGLKFWKGSKAIA
jgi:molybdenum cofactor sulfurtransferase